MITHCLYDKLVALGDLKSHPKNRNKHPDDQIDRLAKVIAYQGWRYPVKVSKRSGFVTSGHGRIEAARLNGWTHVPVNFQDYESDEQEYADVQSDNAIASWAELDLSGINADIGDLGPDFDLDLLGIKDFVIEPIDKLDPQCDEDEVPEAVEPKTKPGDIYQLGRHRLMCGDSTSIDAVERLMAGEKADMVFTDPPYGVAYQSNMRTKSDKFDVIENDETFLTEWVNCLPVVSDGWVSVWSVGKDRAIEYVHPTQKPVELGQMALEYCTRTGNAVLDLFGGSGSTLIACEKTNRRCFMMELDPHYCDVIVARWEKYTGKKAELLNG
jgi:16S rRNA G966 N2-methylase RsmD